MSTSEVLPSPPEARNRRKIFDLNYYGWPETISLGVYIVAGIALLVISIQTFQTEPEDTLNAASDVWKTKTATYQSEAGAAISSSSWSGSVSTTSPSTIQSSSFSVQTKSVSIHHWINSVTSYSLKSSLDISPLLASSPVNDKVDLELKTELNTFTVELDLNFTTQNFSMTLADKCPGQTMSECNQTQKCIDAYGKLSEDIIADASDSTWVCQTPLLNQANCLNVIKHRNDTGNYVWWPSFDVKGCEYPFSEDEYLKSTVPRTSSTILDFYIYAVNDPIIQRKMILKGDEDVNGRITAYVEVDRDDPIPTAVGMMFCALLLLCGSFIMCLKLVPFWHERHQSGLNLMGPILVDEESKIDQQEEEEEELKDKNE